MKYDNKIATKPVWEGNTVYNETVWPIDFDGGELTVPLLYHADKILSVMDTTYQTEYKEGVDYGLKDGGLQVLFGGNIKRKGVVLRAAFRLFQYEFRVLHGKIDAVHDLPAEAAGGRFRRLPGPDRPHRYRHGDHQRGADDDAEQR